MTLIPVHFLDVSDRAIFAPNAQPADLGWALLPGPPQPGGTLTVNGEMMRVIGFIFVVNTVPRPPNGEAPLNMPIIEVAVCFPGKEPKMANLVGVPAAALETLPKVPD